MISHTQKKKTNTFKSELKLKKKISLSNRLWMVRLLSFRSFHM